MREEPHVDARSDVVALIPALRAFARTFERVPEKADDLVQETLLRALKSFDSYLPGTRLKSWLFTIMRNTFYTSYRRHIREAPGSANCIANMRTVPASQEWRCRSNEVREAMTRLAPQQAEVISLVAILGMSYDEAAEVCGCNIGTIKSRLSRARATLLQELDEVSGSTLVESDSRLTPG